jgi:hypothetical protein
MTIHLRHRLHRMRTGGIRSFSHPQTHIYKSINRKGGGQIPTRVKNYVAHASEEMTERYTHRNEKYARKTADILNGLWEIKSIYGNRMETIAPSASTSFMVGATGFEPVTSCV